MADVSPSLQAVAELMAEYRERFGDSYPTFVNPDDSYDEVCRKILDCLERGKPLSLDTSPEILY